MQQITLPLPQSFKAVNLSELHLSLLPFIPRAVNFINILRANFSYERRFGSFSLATKTKRT